MKLQNEFPEADFRVPDPKKEYLRLVNQRAIGELNSVLNRFVWDDLGESPLQAINSEYNSVQEAIRFILTNPFYRGKSDFLIREREEELKKIENVFESIQRPIPGLHDLILYYPVGHSYLQRVRYSTNEPITPLQVLESIYLFYQQPYTQENADAIGDENIIAPSAKVIDTVYPERMDETVKFLGLEPYEDGYSPNLDVFY